MFVRTPRATEVRLGPFRLIERIGRGGMGQVWRAAHEPSGIDVAVKTVTVADPASNDAFHREVRAVAGLDHPGIVWVFDAGTVDEQAERASGRLLAAGSPYLVMELVDGGTLDRGRVHPWGEVHAMLVDVLEALAHAHAHGVIHRDLKPANLLRTGVRLGRPGAYKLADFGIAHALGSGRRDLSPAGTIQYTAPEQLAGRWFELGPWTDLYSLGCLTWLVLTGAPVFGALVGDALVTAHAERPPPSFAPATEVPAGVEPWLRVLLEKEPSARFASAAQAIEALQALDPATVTRAPRRVPREWRDPTVPARPMALIGAGLGLYGLRPFPTAGREAERDALWAHLREAATEAAPRVVQLAGPPGVGRTHLAGWLCARAAEVGAAEVLAWPAGQRWRPAFEGWLGVAGLGADARQTQIERVLARGGTPDEDLAAWVAATLRPDDDRPDVRRTTVRRVVSHLARRGPVVVWLDDTDDDGFLLANEVVERGSGPVLVALAPGVARPGWETLELEPLPPGPHARLVRDLLRLDETLAARVELHTRGSPRFAVELVRGWVARGWLASTPSGFALAASVPADPVLPASIDRVWADRLDPLLAGLGDGGRDALELAACLGRQVQDAVWRRASGDPSACDALLERMLRARLAVGDGDGWRFVEPEFRDVVVAAARAEGRWAPRNRRVADALDPSDPAVGAHLLAAGAPAEALPLLMGAVRAARAPYPATLARLSECDAALDQLGVQVDDPRRAWVLAQRASALNATGATAEAERLLESVEALARTRGWSDVLQVVLRVRASLALNRRDTTGGERATIEWLSLADDTRSTTNAWYLRSIFARLRGDLADAETFAAEGLRLAEAAGDIRSQVDGWKLHGLNAHRAEDLDGIERWLGRALAHYREVADAYGQGDCLNSLARVPLARGDRIAGERLLTQAVAAFEAAGSAQAAYPMLNLGFLSLNHGDVRAARAWLERARDRVTRARRTVLLGLAECGLAACAAHRRDWDAFDTHVAAANRALDAGAAVNESEMRELLERASRHAVDAAEPARAEAARALADRVSPLEPAPN
ncbi:MAG: protein kinase [Myxococcota bacterium]